MIHYIGYYVDKNDKKEYEYNVPGLIKMKYVASALKSVNDSINIYSVCRMKKNGKMDRKQIKTSEGYNLTYRKSTNGNKIRRILDRLLFHFEINNYIKTSVKTNDTVVVYHSVNLTHHIVKQLHRKKINWILEVEEIYGYGATYDNPNVQKEKDDIRKFPKYIFVNDVLPEFLGIKNNYIVCYGSYIAHKRPKLKQDNKVKVVYAGTIEQKKIGAYTAVEAAQFLPHNYEIHIAGFGSNRSISILREKINEIKKKGGCDVIYHGKLEGNDLTKLLFSCEIGLSTYVIKLPFSNCVFPSKLTTYVCHGLKVVVGKSENFERAEISKGWTFYDENDPKAIATAIKKSHESNYIDEYKLIRELDERFKEWLKNNITIYEERK